ncbi:UxaA family hydrolase [Poseidonocella sedimentorum]|uniref:Altronate hydrolase n=1 Tax=Poseidonocella sedimentorum TaxID=871652 RepID=A0A1I6EQ52_9RHOB|nr:altronate dehydratase family protein [Poseidonocella sedimentorum]SFR19632.1 altronate hydrolase [Poseidonocella sedimentorum]
MTLLTLHPGDSVAILTAPAKAGARPLGKGPALKRGLGAGHKIARAEIAAGAPILKFGQIIGYATRDIPAGAHVHVDNCAFGAHDGGAEIGADLAAARAAIPDVAPRQFMGYARPDGRVGTRNMIALIATVNCSATVIRKAAEALRSSGVLEAYPNIDGVVALAHGTGCGMAAEGPGWDNLQRVLWGHATHPNVGAAVFVGLGCEVMQIARMKARFGAGDEARLHGLTIQDSGGTAATIERIVAHVTELLPRINGAHRSPCPLAGLTIGLQCGGSDGLSGITANPALGAASDLLVGHGATVLLSETPEIYGAESLLLRRAASPEVGAALMERITWWERYTELNGGSMDNNPSPGNKAGGLTTILEKSLGAVAKAGATPLNEVVAYGARPEGAGLVFMDTPGYDPVSATGQIAGGAQIIVFTTGRGSAFGSVPAPTLKLATNDRLFAQMRGDMDLNCGDIVSAGVSIPDKGREILDLIVETASGARSKSEALGLGDNEFLPWQIGAVM